MTAITDENSIATTSRQSRSLLRGARKSLSFAPFLIASFDPSKVSVFVRKSVSEVPDPAKIVSERQSVRVSEPRSKRVIFEDAK